MSLDEHIKRMTTTRRGFVSLSGAAVVTLLGACSSGKHTSPASSSSRSSAATASNSASSSSSPGGYQPSPDVRARLKKSGVLLDVEGAQGMLEQERSGAVAVGNVTLEQLAQVADMASEALPQLHSLIGNTPGGDVLLLVPKSDALFGRWSNNDSGKHADITGVTLFDDWHDDPPYIVLHASSPGVTSKQLIDDSAVLAHTIVHEMFHALTLTSDHITAPLWVVEGFAEYAGQQAATLMPEPRPNTPVVPNDTQMRAKDASTYYFLASLLVQHIVETYSSKAAMAFYRAQIASPSIGVDAASRRHLKVPFATVESAWKRGYAAQLAKYKPATG